MYLGSFSEHAGVVSVSALERVRESLTSRGSRIEAQGRDRFLAQCPSHEDGRPSLSVRQGDRGVLLYCFAGCSSRDIAADLGLQVRDLFDQDRVDYRYQDRGGKVVRTVSRTPDKSFPQRGKTKWEQGTAPLYRLPEVVQAVSDNRPVYFVEGEKDCESLRLAGVTATTTAGGASNPHFTDLEPLRGAEVRLIPDNDPEGLKYAGKVLTLLEEISGSVSVWKVRAGKDFSDHYAAGFGTEDLEKVADHDGSTDHAEGDPPCFVCGFGVEGLDREEKPEEATEDPEDDGRRIVLTPASEVAPKVVHWLWEGRLPKSTLTLLGGQQGLGKSTLCVWLAAQTSRGLLPGQSFGKPSPVLWVTTEDDYAYNVVPRLMAAGADLDLIHFMDVKLPSGGTVPPVLPLDLQKVATAIRETGAVLLVVDPLVSVLESRLDSHKDHSVRLALDPISRLARETGATILGITHVGKSRSGDFTSRVLGSVGFTAAARSVLALMRDPDDPEEQRLCLGLAKSNYAGMSSTPTLSLEVRSENVQVGEEVANVGKVVMLGETSRSIADLLSDSDDGDKDDRNEAESWLRAFLLERGGEALAGDIQAACRKDGLSFDVLKKRKKSLGIVSSKAGMKAGWVWTLPEAQTSAGNGEDREKEDTPLEVVEDLDDLGPGGGKCQVPDCDSFTVTTVPLDGKRWGLCLPHSVDPALPLLLGGQQTLTETA